MHRIALTDSSTIQRKLLTKQQKIFMFSKAVHWIKSDAPLGEMLSANAEKDVKPDGQRDLGQTEEPTAHPDVENQLCSLCTTQNL